MPRAPKGRGDRDDPVVVDSSTPALESSGPSTAQSSRSSSRIRTMVEAKTAAKAAARAERERARARKNQLAPAPAPPPPPPPPLEPKAGPSRMRSSRTVDETLVNGIDYAPKKARRRHLVPLPMQSTLTHVFLPAQPKPDPDSGPRRAPTTSMLAASQVPSPSRKRSQTSEQAARKVSSSAVGGGHGRMLSNGSVDDPIALLSSASEEESAMKRRRAAASAGARRTGPHTASRPPATAQHEMTRETSLSRSPTLSQRSLAPSMSSQRTTPKKDPNRPIRGRSAHRFFSHEDEDIDIQLGSQEALDASRMLAAEATTNVRARSRENSVLVAATLSPARVHKRRLPSHSPAKSRRGGGDYFDGDASSMASASDDYQGSQGPPPPRRRRRVDVETDQYHHRRRVERIEEEQESQVPDSFISPPLPPAFPDGLDSPPHRPLQMSPHAHKSSNAAADIITPPRPSRAHLLLNMARPKTPSPAKHNSPLKQLHLAVSPKGVQIKRRLPHHLNHIAKDEESYRPSPKTKYGRQIALAKATPPAARPSTPAAPGSGSERRSRRVQDVPGKYTLPTVDTPMSQWPTSKGAFTSSSAVPKKRKSDGADEPGPSKLREVTREVSASPRRNDCSKRVSTTVRPRPSRLSQESDASSNLSPAAPTQRRATRRVPVPVPQSPQMEDEETQETLPLEPWQMESDNEEQTQETQLLGPGDDDTDVDEAEPEVDDVCDLYADFLGTPMGSQAGLLPASQQTPSKTALARRTASLSPIVSKSLLLTPHRALQGGSGSGSFRPPSRPVSPLQSKSSLSQQSSSNPPALKEASPDLAACILADKAEKDRQDELEAEARDAKMRKYREGLDQRHDVPDTDEEVDHDYSHILGAIEEEPEEPKSPPRRKSKRVSATGQIDSDGPRLASCAPSVPSRDDIGFHRLVRRHNRETAKGTTGYHLERAMSGGTGSRSPEKGSVEDDSWMEEGLETEPTSDQEAEADGADGTTAGVDVAMFLANKDVDDSVKTTLRRDQADRAAAESRERELSVAHSTFWAETPAQLAEVCVVEAPNMDDPSMAPLRGVTDADEMCALLSCGLVLQITADSRPKVIDWLFRLALVAPRELAWIAQAQLLQLMGTQASAVDALCVSVWAKLGAKPEVLAAGNPDGAAPAKLSDVPIARDRLAASMLLCEIAMGQAKSNLLTTDPTPLVTRLTLLLLDATTSPSLYRAVLRTIDALLGVQAALDPVNIARALMRHIAPLPPLLQARTVLALGQGVTVTRAVTRWLAISLLVPGCLDGVDLVDAAPGSDSEANVSAASSRLGTVPSATLLETSLSAQITHLRSPTTSDYVSASYIFTLWLAAASDVPALVRACSAAGPEEARALDSLGTALAYARGRIPDTSHAELAGSLKSRLHAASNVLRMQRQREGRLARVKRLSGAGGLLEGGGGRGAQTQTRLSLGGT